MANSEDASSSTQQYEQRIIALAGEFPKGLSDKEIQNNMPELVAMDRAGIINKLLTQGIFDLFNQNNKLLYKLKDPSRGQAVKGGDNEEKIVYGIIEEAGNKGIWIRDIRYKSNLIPTHLNKILKILENKKLIKAVKSVSASKKKVYMLFNLEPDSSITGGAWYCDQDFEAEFVDVLNQQCYRFLVQKIEENKNYTGGPLASCKQTFASSSDVWKYINDLGISKVQLSVDDMETILNTLVFDGKVKRYVSIGGVSQYRAVNPLLPTTGLVHTACGVCPVIKHCSDFGSVSPKKCVYLKECFE